MAQKPLFRRIGIFVVAMATLMSMSNGMAARRPSRPTIRRLPQTISTTPTNGPMASGNGMPMCANLPASSGRIVAT